MGMRSLDPFSRACFLGAVVSAFCAVPALAAGSFHSLDINQDNVFSLGELLRGVQFFNSGGYHCESGTEDGFAPGAGDESCSPNSADYHGGSDWRLDLSELLRLVQLFNSCGYEVSSGAEDGFAPVFCPTSGVVTFQDPDLEAAVRAKIGVPTGNVTRTDMASIQELEVAGVYFGSASLAGIEFCVSLTSLACHFEPVGLTDAAITARLAEIAQVTSLTSLTVTGDWLVGACGPRTYLVAGTSVDITPLANLTALQSLTLFVNAASLAPLQPLGALKELVSPASAPETVASITALTQLERLSLPFLFWSAPEQLSPLQDLTGLRELVIEGVGAGLEESALPSFPNITALQVSVGGTSANPRSAAFVAAFPGLRSLTFGRVCYEDEQYVFTDYAALGNLSALNTLIFYRPPVIDFSFLPALENLAALSILGGDDRQAAEGGQDLAALLSALTASPRPFSLLLEGCTLSSAACANDLPALSALPGVSVVSDGVVCAAAKQR